MLKKTLINGNEHFKTLFLICQIVSPSFVFIPFRYWKCQSQFRIYSISAFRHFNSERGQRALVVQEQHKEMSRKTRRFMVRPQKAWEPARKLLFFSETGVCLLYRGHHHTTSLQGKKQKKEFWLPTDGSLARFTSRDIYANQRHNMWKMIDRHVVPSFSIPMPVPTGRLRLKLLLSSLWSRKGHIKATLIFWLLANTLFQWYCTKQVTSFGGKNCFDRATNKQFRCNQNEGNEHFSL